MGLLTERIDGRPLSLRKEAHRVIRASIITGEIVAGEVYSAPSLAEALGVSVTPVREALLDLASEGLVEPVRNRGFRVIQFDEADLDEIFELRLLLEVPAVGKIAGTLDGQRAEELWRIVVVIESSARCRDLPGYLAADHDFHTGLIKELGNRRLVELIARLKDQQRLYGLAQAVDSPGFLEGALDHRGILDAVVAGDREQAESRTRRHIIVHARSAFTGAESHDRST